MFKPLFKSVFILNFTALQRQLLFGSLAIFLLTIANALYAQGQRSASPWSVGVMGMWNSEAYRGMDDDWLALPIIAYRDEFFYWLGPRAGFRLAKWDNFSVFATAEYRLSDYEADDSPFLTGMDDRDGTLELGLEMSYKQSFATVSLGFDADVLDKHAGYTIDLKVSRPFTYQRRFIIEPYLGVAWLSSDLADYYYGVKSNEARASRPAYSLDDVVNYTYGIEARYLFTQRTSLFLQLGGERLHGDIEDSPIIEEANQYRIMLGGFYSF
jgi:outer membrane protein